MALIDNRPRRCSCRRMNMFYLIDTSGSMNYNGCIDSVNAAMPEIVDILTDISSSNRDQGEIYLSCITFGNDARMLYDRPVAAPDFRWANVRAGGLTNLEAAFRMLESQMHRSSGLNSEDGHLRPAVILMTDGDPDDGWESALEKLQQNRWFREAYKIAIAIGANAGTKMMKRALTKFAEPLDAGGPMTIINISDLTRLHEVVRFVSSTVSRLGSQSTGAARGVGSVGEEINNAVRREFNPVDGVDIPPISGDDRPWW
ncbi:MAG: hypothetical protein K2I69_05130 [Muribaculaceae bacterium]|nr:hypothetical protein [Muribaculaceae bacterium]